MAKGILRIFCGANETCKNCIHLEHLFGSLLVSAVVEMLEENLSEAQMCFNARLNQNGDIAKQLAVTLLIQHHEVNMVENEINISSAQLSNSIEICKPNYRSHIHCYSNYWISAGTHLIQHAKC